MDLVMIKGDSKLPDDNMVGWKLVSASSTKLEIELEFSAPIEVSQGDELD